MHHDGITGTNTGRTEKDYYKIAKTALDNLSQAQKLITTEMSNKLKPETISEMKNIISKLDDVSIYHITFVNPNGYERNEIVNITLPNPHEGYGYSIISQDNTESKIYKGIKAYKVNMYNQDNNEKQFRIEAKGFFQVITPALGNTQIYLLRFKGNNDACKKAGIK